jgi:hypothetical protein
LIGKVAGAHLLVSFDRIVETKLSRPLILEGRRKTTAITENVASDPAQVIARS